MKASSLQVGAPGAGIRLCLASALLLAAACGGKKPPLERTPVLDGVPAGGQCATNPGITRIVRADMVTLEQSIMYNRLGAVQPGAMIYALARDVVTDDGAALVTTAEWQAFAQCRGQAGDPSACAARLDAVAARYRGAVRLRPDKRPRPPVLRVNVNDCLEISFLNLLDDPRAAQNTAPSSLFAGTHIMGMELAASIAGDASFVGQNANSLAGPGQGRIYQYVADKVGPKLLYSTADSDDSQLQLGLFGAVHVQVAGAESYRSQVTHEELTLASRGQTPAGQPIVDYQATFGAGAASAAHPSRLPGTPILAMLQCAGQTPGGKPICDAIHSDLTAIITGPGAGRFPPGPSDDNPAYPDRDEPFRELAIIYHEDFNAVQAFPEFNDPLVGPTLGSSTDAFGMNYGMGGIGAEILANRLNVGPQGDCVACKYEEFFLSSWAVGDPGMVVDKPASFVTRQKDTCTPEQAYLPGQAVDLNVGATCQSGGDCGQNLTCVGASAGQSGTCQATCAPTPGPKATAAYYPDDPSNVYHSYLRDHVKMQVHHAGAIHHVHHLHAHQWLRTPESDNSEYLDSQLIGPGSSFTLEMVYGGSGNRNQTVGDSIFHCHFYPHFAAGMWALWRVHDVFEAGTRMDGDRPAAGARALPDGEIAAGTPIPGLVPLPTLPMAPMPAPVYVADGQVVFGTPNAPDPDGTKVASNPGFPFYIPGRAGQRAPQPPMDFARDASGKPMDGGLPRHIVTSRLTGPGAASVVEYHNRYDFSKFVNRTAARELPDDGTPVEKLAMAAHAQRFHPSFIAPRSPGEQPAPGPFVLNGLPAVPGAPYADPCALNGDQGGSLPVPVPADSFLTYKAADIQLDAVLNKDGWHYPQQRMTLLWGDIDDTFSGRRPAQPFFFRANSGDCVEYHLTNLVPSYYELDNFQVRTPTDILGQHIHLVKFDVTSSDGAANGWNYEDGTLSPGEVTERIRAINAAGGLDSYTGSGKKQLTPQFPAWLCQMAPTSCQSKRAEWLGAQTTVQRWYVDPLLNNRSEDRTIRTVFTHDHFGPSTHQQAGLYSGLLVEPAGSTWWEAESGARLYTRGDGGPTSWQAIIRTQGELQGYREFALAFQDFQLAYYGGGAYDKSVYPAANATTPYDSSCLNQLDPQKDAKAIRRTVGGYLDTTGDGSTSTTSCLPRTTQPSALTASTPAISPPAKGPQALSAPPGTIGSFSVNYRNEPLGMRLAAQGNQPYGPGRYATPTDCQKRGGSECDTARVYSSAVQRLLGSMNSQHVGDARFPSQPLTSGVHRTDPFTPLLRAYEGEDVQVRVLVGAHHDPHNFGMMGLRWLTEPDNPNSGYRSSESMGISEHFELSFVVPPATGNAVPYTLAPGADAITRTQTCQAPATGVETFADYLYLPSAMQIAQVDGMWGLLRSYKPGAAVCLASVGPPPPPGLSQPSFPSVCPADAQRREWLVQAVNASVPYNQRLGISDPTALLYIGCDRTADPRCVPAVGARPEPLVIRAQAGECVRVTLENKLSPAQTAAIQPGPLGQPGKPFAQVNAGPSSLVGLAPQLVSYDVNTSSGLALGFNRDQLAPVGGSVTYEWYAGAVAAAGDVLNATPVELGAINLLAADPLEQHHNSLIGALIIEPHGSLWVTDPLNPGMPQTASKVIDVVTGELLFHELVVIVQDDIQLVQNGEPLSGLEALNYGTEPMVASKNGQFVAERFGAPPTNTACQFSNQLRSAEGAAGQPETPVFQVPAGAPVRLRVLHAWGDNGASFELFGHQWQQAPYTRSSTVIGDNPQSIYVGARQGVGALSALDVVLPQAGGVNAVPGDYLFRLRPSATSQTGPWGVLRVVGQGGAAAPETTPVFCQTPYPEPSAATEAVRSIGRHPRIRQPERR